MVKHILGGLGLGMGTRRRAMLLVCLVAGTAMCSWALAGIARAAPLNTSKPMISGTPEQGQTLTVKPGTWTDVTRSA